MQNLIKIKEVEETIQFIEKQHQDLDLVKKELQEFINYVKNAKFDLSDEGTVDQRITKITTVLDKYDEVIERRKGLTTTSETLKKNTEGILNKTKEMLLYSGKQEQIEEIHDEMIDKLMELETEKYNKKMCELELRKKNPVPKELKGIVEKDEMDKLEEWTNKKYSELLFDSDKDDWSSNIVFNQRIMNKNQLAFVVEDTNGNKFGGYLNATIYRTNYGNGWENSNIPDSNAFLFSLKSNGRLNGMMKFEIKDTSRTFLIRKDNYSNDLFLFGGNGDIDLNNQSSKKSSRCSQSSCFNYHGISNALCGGYNFTPKRFVVLQMN